MEKIIALIDKLQDLKNENAALSDLAYYTQLLYAELMCAKGNMEREKSAGRRKVAVIMPGYQSKSSVDDSAPVVTEINHPVAVSSQNRAAVAKEKEIVTEHRIETQPEPAVTIDETVLEQRNEVFIPKTLFDQTVEPVVSYHRPVSVPSSNGRELNEVIAENKPSLNDKLKTEKVDLAAKLHGATHINDLSRAIDINDKFLFINELFRGDRDMYDRSIKTINGCSDLEAAKYWIERELKIKLGWQDKDAAVQQFYYIIRKRFVAA